MQKIQVMLDDNLVKNLKINAKKYGLSVSSFVRVLVSSAYKKQLLLLEKTLLNTNGDNHYTGQAYLKKIQKMIDDA